MAITPVYCCGLECVGANDSAAGHFNLTGSSIATITTATVNNGLRALSCKGTLASSYATTTLSASGTWVLRCYVRFVILPSITSPIVTMSGSLVGAYFQASDSKIYAGYGVSSLGATGVAVTTGVWYYIDVKAVTTADPWTIDVNVSGTACAQITNAVAADTTRGGIVWGIDAAATHEVIFDDLIASNTAADYPIGAGKVLASSPVADGTHSITAGNFVRGVAGGAQIVSTGVSPTTDSYLLIDDVPMSSGAASDFITQVTSAAAEYVAHLYATATATDGPRAVEVLYRQHKVTSAQGGFRFKLLDNGVTALIENFLSSAFNSSGPTYKHVQLASMVGGGSWTLARYNLKQTRWGYSTDANPDVSLDAVMFEAEFDAPAAGPVNVPVTATGNYGVGYLTLNAAAPNLVIWTPVGAALYGYP